jgi:hypothetical protein
LPVWETFRERANNIITACVEIRNHIETKRRTKGWYGQFSCRSLDVEELGKEFGGTADYLFTDPPYGGHISYLDLSILWNNWLNHTPDAGVQSQELIVGGQMRFSEDHYISRLYASMRACVRMLKMHRWMTVVFQHWNTAYFEAILSAAADEGAELRSAVPQVGDVIWSMHKKKNRESVLSGELLLTFFKTGYKCSRLQSRVFDIKMALADIFASEQTPRIHVEEVLNRLILSAWRQSALHSLNVSKDDLLELVKNQGWRYDQSHHCWVKPVLSSLFDDV